MIRITKIVTVETAAEALSFTGDLAQYPQNEIRLVSDFGDKILSVEDLQTLSAEAAGEAAEGTEQATDVAAPAETAEEDKPEVAA